MEPLLGELHLNVQQTIYEGVTLKWESHRLDAYVKRMSDVVLGFYEKVLCCFSAP